MSSCRLGLLGMLDCFQNFIADEGSSALSKVCYYVLGWIDFQIPLKVSDYVRAPGAHCPASIKSLQTRAPLSSSKVNQQTLS